MFIIVIHVEVEGSNRFSTNETKIAGSEKKGKPLHSVANDPVFEILKWTTCHISERVTSSNDRGQCTPCPDGNTNDI